MPTSTRRQVLGRARPASIDETSEDLPDAEEEPPVETLEGELDAEIGNEQELDEEEAEEDEGEGEGEEGEQGVEDDQPFPPPGLKEISSLASWTVSTAKPGNGVAALRSSDMAQFWQSDGPQPHLLSIHFFKLVPIVLIRIFLDFRNDESYTPTKIQFLAGMGAHDLQEFAEMEFERPTGWIEVDFTNVGPILDDSDEEQDTIDWSRRPILRAMLVQVKILENHQNGKDTHLRGVQIFARDETQEERLPTSTLPYMRRSRVIGSAQPQAGNHYGIRMASWMQDPDLR